MATLSITLTAAQTTRILAAAKAEGYPETAAGAQQWIVDWLKVSVRFIEQRKAEAALARVADF